MTRYPTVEDLVFTNMLAVTQIRAKKADRHGVLSYPKIDKIISDVKAKRGTVYDKAAVLMIGLIKAHAFESGNRRTAWAATRAFVRDNGGRLKARYQDGVMMGIREGFYTEQSVRNWLIGHGLEEFRRG